MDNKKINTHLILLLIVAVIVFGIAVLCRLVAVSSGLDAGTANLIFVGVIAVCGVVYLIIRSTLEDTVMPKVLKKLGFKPREVENTQESDLSPCTNTIDPKSTAQSLKEKAIRVQAEDFEKRIQLFVAYAHSAVGPHIPEKDLQRLGEYVELYARNAKLPAGLEPITAKDLANPDLFHFGWNMWHHFRVGKQGDVALWLKTVFANLRQCETAYVIGKLTVGEHGHYQIPQVKDIAGYMADMER